MVERGVRKGGGVVGRSLGKIESERKVGEKGGGGEGVEEMEENEGE